MATQTINKSSAAGVRQQTLPIDNPRTQDYDNAIARSARAHSNESSDDFRFHFFSKPSLPMLEAIISTSLGDGDMGEDETTSSFQDYMADLVSHEASILVMIGRSTSWHSRDYREHIDNSESGGAATHCGALIKGVVPPNGPHLTLEDVKKNALVTETYYDAPTRVISLENMLAGTIKPLVDIRTISQWAPAQDPPTHMHLDEARLWEAATAGACTLREIGECFDSIQMCLAKGLGAAIGSVVTGTIAFIKRTNWARKLLDDP